jgi:hypothetical protein
MNWRCNFFRFAATYFCFFSARNLSAQFSESDSNFYQTVISHAISIYHHTSGDQSGLYNGILYPGYPFVFKSGTPFFDSSRSDTGSVFYDGILYENLPLTYEDLKDVVIVKDNGYYIELNSKKLNEFTIPGHHFIRLEEKDGNNSGLITGFYELLFKDSIYVLKKTVKKIEDDLSSDNVVEKLITQTDYYYIRKDSSLYLVRNKKDVTAILPDKKKEILQFIKKNKLNFSDDKGSTLVQIATYYEQLRK